jgi:hypothetical protein
VVKIENPGVGDPGRRLKPGGVDDDPWYFHQFNANKKSLTLNLKSPRGLEIVKELLKKADVTVENMAPGTMERLGLGYDEVKKINPGIIYCRVKGFGVGSPYEKNLAFDMIAQAAGGPISVTGYGDRPPVKPGPSFGDTGTGMLMAISILGSLFKRAKTGQGRRLEAQSCGSRALGVRVGVADVHGAIRRRAESRERELEDLRRRLRRARLGRRDDRVEQRSESERGEVVVQADVPVGDDGEPKSGGCERPACVRRARQLLELERCDERRRELGRVDRRTGCVEEDVRAVLPQQRERRLVASLVRAHDVELDLGAERGTCLLLRPRDPVRGERRPERGHRIVQRDERAVGVDGDRVERHPA